MSRALWGQAWFDGAEWRLWDLVHEPGAFLGDGFIPLLKSARELFHEAGGWFVSEEGQPVFVDRLSWARARSARPARR